MYETSGSLVFRSGVGTQMFTVSSLAISAKSVVACRRPAATSLATSSSGHIGNVGRPRADRVDLSLIDVEADDVIAGVGELDRERQPDIPEADYAGAHSPRTRFAASAPLRLVVWSWLSLRTRR